LKSGAIGNMKKFNIPLCFFVIFLLLLLPVYSASELAQINGSYENVKDESIGEVIESTIENNNSTISESDLKEGIISQDLNNNCNYAQEFWPSGAIGNIEPQKDNDWWRIYVGKGKLTVDLDTSIWLFSDNFGTNNKEYDFDNSGRVEFNDLFIFSDNFGLCIN